MNNILYQHTFPLRPDAPAWEFEEERSIRDQFIVTQESNGYCLWWITRRTPEHRDQLLIGWNRSDRSFLIEWAVMWALRIEKDPQDWQMFERCVAYLDSRIGYSPTD